MSEYDAFSTGYGREMNPLSWTYRFTSTLVSKYAHKPGIRIDPAPLSGCGTRKPLSVAEETRPEQERFFACICT
jgi:hypothetical protein